MNSRALTSVAILGMVASLFVGCGDGDSTKLKICSPRAVQCLTDKGGLVCASDGTVKYPFSCDDGQICGTDEEGKTGCVGGCEPGETECASEAISRVCSDDGKTWIPVACEPGTGCDGNAETDEGEPNPDYGTCVRSDDPTVTVCTPDQTTCADGQTVKACETDGSNWVYTACLGNEACEDGECVVDPDKRCTPNTGTCVDATHVKKCADNGEEYLPPETCPGTSTCSDGACRGPVCTVGEVRCDDVRDGNVFTALAQGTYQPRALYTCIDGERWEVTECGQTDVCAYTDISSTAVNQYIEDLKSAMQNQAQEPPVFNIPDSSRATCQTPECAAPFALRELLGGFYEGLYFGSFACGDPTDDDPSTVDSFSLCEGLPPYNNLHWSNYTCPTNTECTYASDVQPAVDEDVLEGKSTRPQGPACVGTCTDGDIRCYDSQGESTITCQNGEWDISTITRCADGGREQWCRRNLTGSGTNFTQASCQDPACVVWQDEFETFAIPPGYGACGDDGKFYQCLPDGTMDAGVDCPSCVRSSVRAPGIVPPSTNVSHFAGYRPGYCLAECADTEQMCLPIGGSQPSPFYYECEGGHWSAIVSCPDGEACNDVPPDPEVPNSARRIICGDIECYPDQTACVDEDGNLGGPFLSTCNGRGEWGAPVECDRGVCTSDDQQATGKAACEDECIPRTKSCRGNAEVTCGNAARYGEPEPCETGTVCMSNSSSLARLGCIECVPSDPTNSNQRPDSRCNGSKLEVCGPDGTWATGASTTCPGVCASNPNPVPGNSRAQCETGSGGQAGGGQAGSGAAGRAGGAGGGAGGAGAGGAGGIAGFPNGGFGNIDG